MDEARSGGGQPLDGVGRAMDRYMVQERDGSLRPRTVAELDAASPRYRPRIYVIGPFRAPTELGRRRNVARAEDAALQLAKAGALYRCPHLHSAHFDGQEPGDAYWLELGMDLLAECDAAYLVEDAPDAPSVSGGDGEQRSWLLPRWLSKGSAAEVKWCREHGLTVLETPAQVAAFVKRWTEDHPRPKVPRACNIHRDCDAADAKARANGRLHADHCHDDCCEDCFGQ